MKNILNTIETERIVLRSPSLKYVEVLQSAISESIDDLKFWLKWAQKVPSIDECVENANKAIEAFQEQKDLQYYIFLKKGNVFIGCAGLHRIDWSVPKAEIGYWIRTSYQRQGYATEASKLLTKLAFNKLKVNRVEIRCDDNNLKSKSVAKKMDFLLEGVLRNDTLTPDGQLRNTAIFSKVEYN